MRYCFWSLSQAVGPRRSKFSVENYTTLKTITHLSYFLALDATALVASARFLKRSTRPAVSRTFSLPE